MRHDQRIKRFLPVVPEGWREHRNRRLRTTRSITIKSVSLTKRALRATHEEYPDDVRRPVTRGECLGAPRPCPFVSCKYHLYLDRSTNGRGIKLNFPDLEPGELGVSCCLDVTDLGSTALEDVGAIMNLTRERVRQIEIAALKKLAALLQIDEVLG